MTNFGGYLDSTLLALSYTFQELYYCVGLDTIPIVLKIQSDSSVLIK